MLPGYLWQMPLYWGRCLRPIHGCCGMRLPRRFWPALPKPFGSSVVSPLPITSSPKIPNLVYKNGLDVWDSDNHRLQRPRDYLRAVAAGLLHPSPARLPLLLSPSSLSSVPGSSRADLFGEWESTRLYLSAAEFGPASCWMTLEPFVGSTYITPVPPALSAPAWPPIRTEENLYVGVFQGLSSEEYYWCSHVVVSTTLSLSNLLSCSLLCYENRHVQLHTQTASSSHHLLDLSQNCNRLTN